MTGPEFSIVVPCHNEEGNLPPLVEAIDRVLSPLEVEYEVVITDDRSSDRSWEVLQELAQRNPRVRGQRLRENRGESAASWAGMQLARGRYIVTMDADLQNDPEDLPRFIDGLKQADCVCGSRVESRGEGDHIIRIASSRIANWVRNALSGEEISDAGCTYRAFRRECIGNLKYFRGMHRFLPTLFKIEGYSVIEIPVANNPRLYGSAHYGVWNRLFASFHDLLAVRWMKSRMVPFEVEERIGGETDDPGRR
ncbi:MAG TPA: glycosyltransferase [Sedimenticola thiotaurini]|uniref:Glycosyltransferase n=1 Tax=Sedimenticola thiotaurini TaxID=1543721 RepID=A0A831RKU7_9GAMM|nr:glycosyltransferase [Sedimenticola thiotaurini]